MIADVHCVVMGAGGLGCPALLGLRMAGAKRITIVDHDTVEVSNLHRQVLYDTGDVGAPKAEVAARWLRRHGIEATARVERLVPDAVDGIIAALPRDAVVVECTDAPALKFATNDACVRHGRRLVLGAAIGMRGHAIAVVPGSACYRCVFEAPPPGELVPSCVQAGVLGAAVGTTGMFLAHLATVLVEGHAASIAGRLFELALGSGVIRTLGGRPRAQCPCATAPSPSHHSPVHATVC